MNGKQRWKLGGRVPSTAASAATEACILMQTLQALRALEDLEEKDCPKIGCTPIAQKNPSYFGQGWQRSGIGGTPLSDKP